MDEGKETNVKNITDEQLIQDYKNELLHEDDKEQKALVTVTTAAINKGKTLNKLKPLVERNGFSWSEFLEKELSFINKKQDQRYRRLAINIDVIKYPNLALLPMDTLSEIIKKTNAIKSLETVFDDGCVDLKTALTSPELIHAFKKDVQEMLSKDSDSGDAKSEQAKLVELINKSKKTLINKLDSYKSENKKLDLKNNKPAEALKLLIDELNKVYIKITEEKTEDKIESLSIAA